MFAREMKLAFEYASFGCAMRSRLPFPLAARNGRANVTMRPCQRLPRCTRRDVFENTGSNFTGTVYCLGDRWQQQHLSGIEARTGATDMGEQDSFPTLQLPSPHCLHARRAVRLPLERRHRLLLDASG